ncbi:hypothetical protein G7075_00395 [Phycicoccus sp. HDW14]|uniref:hypothetical protein n=1 Tax=Phycicoccus sp. HDW14 TaxID=2714941 RepID=UPI0014094552|nr:hypothetical protein [Phycicoccus sp. HDW14]QIM19949.1 hypothetical protein G7075_00395 [Phycicoccus sp. HDW14]
MTLNVKALRPMSRVNLEDHPMLLEVRGASLPTSVTAAWTATAARREGVMQGETTIPVSGDFDLRDMWLGRPAKE